MNRKTLHPCLEHHSLIKEICSPLQSIGVNFFGYTALDKTGNAYCLGSETEYAEQYLKREHVKKDILVEHREKQNKYEYDFWDFQVLDTAQQELYSMAAEFDQSHTLSISQQDNGLSHSFHFSGSVSDEGLNQRLLEKMDCLHLFIDSFKEKLVNVKELAALYEYGTDVTPQTMTRDRVIDRIKTNPMELNLTEQAKKTLQFKSHVFLTANERDCLRWLALGKSAQMISEINRVSRKTVERHIASIKEKLGCYTLFQMGIQVAEKKMSNFLPKSLVN